MDLYKCVEMKLIWITDNWTILRSECGKKMTKGREREMRNKRNCIVKNEWKKKIGMKEVNDPTRFFWLYFQFFFFILFSIFSSFLCLVLSYSFSDSMYIYLCNVLFFFLFSPKRQSIKLTTRNLFFRIFQPPRGWTI